MLRVPSIKRSDVDRWNVETSGLASKVATILKRNGITTIGKARQLSRNDLRHIRGIGGAFTTKLHRFVDTCALLVEGQLQFKSIEHLLRSLVKPNQYEILKARFGLAKGSKPQSLGAVGQHNGMTRERVRQVEAAAIAGLESDFAQTCMSGLHAALGKMLSANRGAMTLQEAAGVEAFDFDKLEPSATLRLLCKCGSRFSCKGDLICILDEGCCVELEKELARQLRLQTRPLPAIDYCKHVHPLLKAYPQDVRTKLVSSILDRLARASVVDGDRYFAFESGAAGLLAEIIQGENAPVHYRQITREFNSRVRNVDRKGTRHILDILNGSQQFARASSGYYVLAARSIARRATA